MTRHVFVLSYPQSGRFLIHDLSPRVCNKSNTTGATSRAGTPYPLRAVELNPDILVCSCSSSYFVFCVVIWISLFVPFLWPLHCLFFFNLWLHTIPVISSTFSCEINIAMIIIKEEKKYCANNKSWDDTNYHILKPFILNSRFRKIIIFVLLIPIKRIPSSSLRMVNANIA